MNFDLLKQIHSWTHPYIHGGYRPAPWKTETALHCLKDLFYAGQTSTPIQTPFLGTPQYTWMIVRKQSKLIEGNNGNVEI